MLIKSGLTHPDWQIDLEIKKQKNLKNKKNYIDNSGKHGII